MNIVLFAMYISCMYFFSLFTQNQRVHMKKNTLIIAHN